MSGTSSHPRSLQQECQALWNNLIVKKCLYLNVSNLSRQCFHIASSLGPDLRPLKTILTSLAEFRKTRGAYFSEESLEQRSQTPDLAAPFPHPRKAQHHPWVPILGLPLIPVLQQILITALLALTRHCTIHTHQIRVPKGLCQHQSHS